METIQKTKLISRIAEKMKTRLKQRWFLTVVLALFIFSDCILTLAGQPDSYWTDRSVINESSPIGMLSLKISPFVFICELFVYWVIASIISLRLPRNISMIYVTLIIVIHCCCIESWLRYHYGFGWKIELWYSPVVAIIIWITYKLDQIKSSKSP